MGADAEFHSQIVGGAWGILWKRGGRIAGARGIKDTIRMQPTEPTDWTQVGSETSGGMYESDLSPLNICYGCVAPCSLGSPKSGSKGCPWIFYLPLRPFFFPTGLPHPALVWEYVSGLIVACYVFGWCPRKASERRWSGALIQVRWKRKGGEILGEGKEEKLHSDPHK